MAFIRFGSWWAAVCVAGLLAPAPTGGGEATPHAPLPAHDTLAAEFSDPEHRALLDPMTWPAQRFTVVVEPTGPGDGDADYLVRFPSPHAADAPGEPASADVVYLDWYVARDAQGEVAAGPSVIVMPETSRRRTAGKALARALRGRGIHGFVLQPPGYARRGSERISQDATGFLHRVRQTVADARRARDAVTALPTLGDQPVHLAGISLGGFLGLLTAELDGGFDGVFILLAGGDLHGVVSRGARDSAKFRERLAAAGVEGDDLRQLLWQVEPLRAADRLDPRRTWLYSGAFDTVVPPFSPDSLAASAGLEGAHHRRLPIGHYSGILIFPSIAGDIAERVLAAAEPTR